MARSDIVNALIAGNTATRGAALQASEIGLANAYAQLASLASEETSQTSIGYFALRQDEDGGVPKVDWSTLPSDAVGSYTVGYAIERLCNGPTLPVAEPLRFCVVSNQLPAESSTKSGAPDLGAAIAKQYRVTVRVTGPHDTLVYVQDLVLR
jgi:type IV pilus assembly protein PilX